MKLMTSACFGFALAIATFAPAGAPASAFEAPAIAVSPANSVIKVDEDRREEREREERRERERREARERNERCEQARRECRERHGDGREFRECAERRGC
jgi:hypothetical protein